MATFNKSDWKYLGGSARNYQNVNTGEIISRRRYDTLSKGISYEAKAAHNRAINPKLAVLRPARGRKSALRYDAETREQFATSRIERAEVKRREREEEKARKALEREIARKQKKRVRAKHVTKQSLRPGNMAIRYPFNDYGELSRMLDEAKKIGVVFGYSLGWHGVDTRTGQEKDVTVFTLSHINTRISEDEFYDEMDNSYLDYSYLSFMYFWVHIRFTKQYAIEKAIKAGRTDWIRRYGA